MQSGSTMRSLELTCIVSVYVVDTIPMTKRSQTCPGRVAEDGVVRTIMRSFPESRVETRQSRQAFITGRATARIKITQMSNFAVFRPAGATRFTD